MKYKNTIKIAKVSFKVISIASLVGAIASTIGLVFLEIAAVCLMAWDKGRVLPDIPSFGKLLQLLHSPWLIVEITFLALGMALIFMIFRNLAWVIGHLDDNSLEDRLVILRLDSTVRILLFLFAVDSLHIACSTYLFDKVLPILAPENVTSTQYSLKNYLSHDLWYYVFPSFPGTSALVFALLIYILARFLEEKARLREEVEVLRKDSELTV
ncbi:MAG: hypothetical protein HY537_01190 [Deltaproteobacteria bacterium]|nr:hypothetical protein [Deltaproteobacteria bacterium]